MNERANISESNEIDLIEILRKLWKGRMVTAIMTFSFALLGIIFALTDPEVYTANTTFLPKEKSTNFGGNLGGLASLAGINLGSLGSNSEISPNLFPMIVKSNPFLEKLLEVKLPKDYAGMTWAQYLSEKPEETLFSKIKKYTIGLPALMKASLLKKNQPLESSFQTINKIRHFTSTELDLYRTCKSLIKIVVDPIDGYITLSVEDKSPVVAAIITMNAKKILQEQVINFKLKNARDVLSFTETLFAEKKLKFEAAQDELAKFRDQNRNISSGLFENKLSRLTSEYTILRAVYEEMAKQVEQARIQVTRDTPIFTVIEPVVIPNERTSPKRALMVIGYTIFGFVFSLFFNILKGPFYNLLEQIIN